MRGRPSLQATFLSSWPARRRRDARPLRRRQVADGLHLQRLESRLALATAPQPIGTVFEPSGFTPLGAVVVFAGDSAATGTELWTTDGTAAGTKLLKDIRANAGSSWPGGFTAIGSTLYFTADDGITGFELWKTDGTAAGTLPLKDINPGAGSSNPSCLRAVGNRIFFAADDGTNGSELWMTDGTPNGTVRVKDINPNGGSSNPVNFTACGTNIFFMADDGSTGRELWKTDGTPDGTVRVADIAPGSADAFELTPRRWLAVGSMLYFQADDGTSGVEPWTVDATSGTASRLIDIKAGGEGSDPRGFALLGTKVLFWAKDTNYRFWSSDGTTAGTTAFYDLGPANAPVSLDFDHPGYTATVDGRLYFSYNEGVLGTELWRTDGTAAGTTLVKDINDGGSANIKESLVVVGSTMYFKADNFNPKTGYELWTSDGTAGGTVLVQDLVPGADGSLPEHLAVIGQKLYFSARDAALNRRLWVLDTAAVATLPGAPTAVTGVPGNGQVVLSWTPPALDGGAPITSYAVEYSSDAGSTWKTFSYVTVQPPPATVAVMGLGNGTGYVFRVTAVNAVGAGPASTNSAVVTPASPLAAAPVFSDGFARTDGTPLPPPWRLATGAATITAGRLAQATSVDTAAVVDTLSAADVRVQAVVDLAGAGQAGLVARVSGMNVTPSLYLGGLFASAAGVRAEIWRRSGGAWTQLGPSVAAPATSGTLAFSLVGPTLSLALDNVPLVTATDSAGGLTTPGTAGVWLSGGGGATADDVSIAELLPPDAIGFTLQSDTGPGAGDSISSVGGVTVTGLAPQAAWQWSSNGGSTWNAGVGSGFTLPVGTFDTGSVRVQQLTPTIKMRKNATRIIVDKTAPVAAALAKPDASATMLVSGLEPGAAWKLSVDGGATWTPGPGSGSFILPAGPYPADTIRIVQTDLAGNDGPSTGNATGVLVDAGAAAPAFADAFNRPDGSPLAATLWRFAGGTAVIAANRLAQAAPAEAIAVVDGLAAVNQRVQAVVNLSKAGQAGLVARVTGTGSALSFYGGCLTKTASGVRAEIWRRSGNTLTQIGTSVAAPAASGTLALHVVGPRLALSMNGVPLVVATDSSGPLAGPGTAGVWLRNGSGATVDDFSVAEVPPVDGLGFALQSDTGASVFDWITKDGAVTVNGLAQAATWRWTRNGGATWTNGSGTSFTLPAGSYDAGLVRVEQLTPSAKTRQGVMRVVVDATPPAAVTLSRASLKVTVAGLEPAASYRSSVDGGAAWTTGQGLSFDLPIATVPSGTVKVVQVDVAGNDSPVATLPSFRPVFTPLAGDTFSRPDGTVLGKATGATGSWNAALGSFKLAAGTIQPTTSGVSVVRLPGKTVLFPGFNEADVRVAATIDVGTSGGAGVVARFSGSAAAGSMLFGLVSRTVKGGVAAYRAEIWRQNNGVSTLLSSAAVGTGTGTLRLDCMGRLAVLSFNDVVVTSFNDLSTSAVTGPGTVGLRFGGNAARADNFLAARITL